MNFLFEHSTVKFINVEKHLEKKVEIDARLFQTQQKYAVSIAF